MTGYRTRAPEQGTTRLAAADRWDWHSDAECSGMDLGLFFAPDGERLAARTEREKQAKAVCWRCPLEQLCRDDAVARNDHWGVRGGLTPDEIQAERRRRQRKGALDRPGTCAYGHPRTDENTHRDRNGHQRCLPCYKSGSRASKKRAAA